MALVRAMPSPPSQVLLIGVDGGASEVRAHQVLVLSAEGALSLALGPASASMCYDRVPGFEPVPVAEQLRALEQKKVRPSAIELRQGRLCVEAAASAILSVASQAECERALVGMCMPGLKTADQRGIAVLKNGPRQPEFLDQLERELERGGLALARPIHALVSDGEACALGEELRRAGRLPRRAERLLPRRRHRPGRGLQAGRRGGWARRLELDHAQGLADESRLGAGFEELVSVRGANERFAARTGRGAAQHPDEFVEVRARDGDRAAQAVLTEAGEALAELLCARITALERREAGRRARAPSAPAHAPRSHRDRTAPRAALRRSRAGALPARSGRGAPGERARRRARRPRCARTTSRARCCAPAGAPVQLARGAALGAAALAWRSGSKGASTRAVQG
jgi:hypothetical protein